MTKTDEATDALSSSEASGAAAALRVPLASSRSLLAALAVPAPSFLVDGTFSGFSEAALLEVLAAADVSSARRASLSDLGTGEAQGGSVFGTGGGVGGDQ